MKKTIDEKINIVRSFAYNFKTYKETALYYNITPHTVVKYINWFLEKTPISENYTKDQLQKITNILKRKLDKSRKKINLALAFANDDFDTLDEYVRYIEKYTKDSISPSTAGKYLHWFIENIIYLPGYSKKQLKNICYIIEKKIIKNVKNGYGESTLKVKASYAKSKKQRRENRQKASELFISLQSEYIKNKEFNQEKLKQLANLLFISTDKTKELLIVNLQKIEKNVSA